jgi:hypothetical protein
VHLICAYFQLESMGQVISIICQAVIAAVAVVAGICAIVFTAGMATPFVIGGLAVGMGLIGAGIMGAYATWSTEGDWGSFGKAFGMGFATGFVSGLFAGLGAATVGWLGITSAWAAFGIECAFAVLGGLAVNVIDCAVSGDWSDGWWQSALISAVTFGIGKCLGGVGKSLSKWLEKSGGGLIRSMWQGLSQASQNVWKFIGRTVAHGLAHFSMTFFEQMVKTGGPPDMRLVLLGGLAGACLRGAQGAHAGQQGQGGNPRANPHNIGRFIPLRHIPQPPPNVAWQPREDDPGNPPAPQMPSDPPPGQ